MKVPRDPVGVVLVLHGGGNRGGQVMVSPTQLSVLRMVPIARRIARAGKGRLAVFRLLNSVRGWDSRHTPVADVRWALGEVQARLGELPVGLVGHSLGGRAALLSGDSGPVRSVVALAPWLYDTDVQTGGLEGRRVLIVHGDRDRIASPQASLAVAERLESTTDVTYVRVEGGKHAMLRHGRTFTSLASDFTVDVLTGTGPTGRLAAVLDAPFPAVVSR
ncbi:alpha/beta hydrolase [Jatrophihabitans sp. YIM 134969]